MFHLRKHQDRPIIGRTDSILRKVFLNMLLLAASVVVLLAAVAYAITSRSLEERIFAQLSAATTVAEEGIDRALQDEYLQTTLLAGHAEVLKALDRSGDMVGLYASMREQEYGLIGMAVFDDAGNRVAFVDNAPTQASPQGVHPVYGRRGWQYTDVAAPIRGGEGSLTLRFDASAVVDRVLSVVPALGKTGEVFLGIESGSNLMLLKPSTRGSESYALILGNTDNEYSYGLALARAVRGQEGVGLGEDHRGSQVLSAYRPLRVFQGGIVIQVERADALQIVTALTRALLANGLLVVAFASLLALLLSRTLTRPLRTMMRAVRTLGPGNWNYESVARTGDEIEVLDRVIENMAQRLKAIYDHLEEEVRKRTQELRAQYVFDRTVLDSIRHGIVAVDAAGNVTAVNPAATALLGWTAEEMLGRAADAMIRVSAKGVQVMVAQHCLETKTLFRAQPGQRLCIACKDGTPLPVMLLASPLQDDKSAFGAVIVFQDMRDERRMDEMKSEFVTLASHQLRTPISILRWHTELLKEIKTLTDDQIESVDEIGHAAERMTNLLNALIKVVQLEDGAITPDIMRLDAREVVAGVINELKDIYDKKQMRCELDPPVDPVMVHTDQALLGIVVHNLLTNAAKYSPDKTVVNVILRQEGARWTLTVVDQGLGIPDREQAHLFQKFFRAKNVRTIDTDGSGLGLYIMKLIVESLGGSITFHSQEGQGTTFVVSLPTEPVIVLPPDTKDDEGTAHA